MKTIANFLKKSMPVGKKAAFILIATILALICAGCGSSGGKTVSENKQQTIPESTVYDDSVDKVLSEPEDS